jgi:hypothetical protein
MLGRGFALLREQKAAATREVCHRPIVVVWDGSPNMKDISIADADKDELVERRPSIYGSGAQETQSRWGRFVGES